MKIKHIIIAYSSIIAFASCNYLDYDETNGLNTREDIYRYFDKTKQMLTHVYAARFWRHWGSDERLRQ